MHTQLSSGVTDLQFGPNLHLHPFCVQDVKADQTEPLLLSYEISMEMFRHLLFYVFIKYSKTGLKRPLKNIPNKGPDDKW